MPGKWIGKIVVGVLLAMTVSSTVQALSEWTLHRTADGQHPNAEEQQMLWLTNRARANPTKEGLWLARSKEFHVANGRDYFNVNRRALVDAFARLKPRPPAAFDARLFRAALSHTKDQIARDVQDHDGQIERINAAGFFWDQVRYNVFSYADSALNAHAGFNIDWGLGTPTGMQSPPSHRLAIMSVDGDFTNVGIAGLFERDPRTRVGRYVVSQNFCRAQSGRDNHFNAFVVGTVWRDLNDNDRYDPGEGIEGVNVVPGLGDYYAVTSRGGGYAFPITHAGRMRVQFTGGGIEQASYDVTAGDVSVLVDHKLNSNGQATVTSRSYDEPVIFLTEGVRDLRQFGNKTGNDRHERRISAYFNDSSEDLLLTLQSQNINRPREAEVFVNGQSLGFLSGSKKSSRRQQERFIIPATLLKASNRLDIHQRYDDEKWAVGRLLLAKATTYAGSLAVGKIDAGPYGWGAGGRHHRALYRTRFSSVDRDLDLQFEAWDVTHARDLEIRLNGEHLAWVDGQKNSIKHMQVNVAIPVEYQREGDNLIEFVSHLSHDWGVRKLQLIDVNGPVDDLQIGHADQRRLGWRFTGGRHRTLIKRRFQSQESDLVFAMRANFRDNKDALDIRINGQHIGQIRAAQGNQLKRFSIPLALQNEGENTIEIHRRLRSPATWVVADLLLTRSSGPLVTLSSDRRAVSFGRQYGWRWGSNEHRTVVRSEFLAGETRSDLVLTGSGFNIRNTKQVSVHLNGKQIGYLLNARDTMNSGDWFILPAADQRKGVNQIEFRNNQLDETWGLTDLTIEPAIGPTVELKVGVTDYASYAIRGDKGRSPSRSPSVVTATFYSSREDMDLRVVGYDIEKSETVAIYINGVRIGRLSPGSNNAFNSGEHFLIPASLQNGGLNEIQFRRLRPHSRWGITGLTLTPQLR